MSTQYLSIPLEIRKMISDCLDQYDDVQNLCIADKGLFEYMKNDLKKMSVTRQVFGLLLEKKYFDKTDVLSSRLVCKRWNRCLDFNLAGPIAKTYKSHHMPRVSLDVAMTEKSAEKLRQFAHHQHCKIVGKALKLQIRGGSVIITTELCNELISNVPNTIWNQVENLWVDYGTYSSALAGQPESNILKILSKLVSLKAIVFCCNRLPFTCVAQLPNMGQLEELTILPGNSRTKESRFEPVLANCSASLKRLSIEYESNDLEECMWELKFPQLEYLKIPERSLLIQPGNLDNLKSLSVILDWDDSGLQLVETSHLCKSLEYISIDRRVQFDDGNLTADPKYLPVFRTGNPSVVQLQIRSNDVESAINVAQLFPSIQQLTLITVSVRASVVIGSLGEVPVFLEHEDLIIWNAFPKLQKIRCIGILPEETFFRSNYERQR